MLEMNVDGNWGSCPAEILIMIFRYLDAIDLLACRRVSTIWRVNADYCGDKCEIWLQLLENIQNKGFNSRQRTELDVRMLYLNSRMWYSVHKAQVKLKHVYDLIEIQNIHVYRDHVIVIRAGRVKFFNLETGTLMKEVLERCVDYQETDYLVAKITRKENQKHISLYSKRNNETYESLGIKLYNLQHNKCHFTTWKNAVDFFECTPKGVIKKLLGRYYSNPRLLCSIYMYENDMYIYISKGDVFHRRNGELQIQKVCTLDVPSPPTYLDTPTGVFLTMFHKCSVVYGVQSKEKEGIVKNVDIYGEEHLVLLYSGLTCAIQHDNVLLLGFEDGKVGFVIIKKLWTTYDLTPAFQFYIQEVAQVQEVEAVRCLEVYEAESCHHVLISTRSKLYQVVISHADYNKVMV